MYFVVSGSSTFPFYLHSLFCIFSHFHGFSFYYVNGFNVVEYVEKEKEKEREQTKLKGRIENLQTSCLYNIKFFYGFSNNKNNISLVCIFAKTTLVAIIMIITVCCCSVSVASSWLKCKDRANIFLLSAFYICWVFNLKFATNFLNSRKQTNRRHLFT